MRIVLGTLLIGACGAAPAVNSPAPAPPPVASPEPSSSTPTKPEPPPSPAPPSDPPAPWEAEPVDAAAVPKIYFDVHRKAENRASCPLLVITETDAKPRRASFAGGWAVAYDAPGERSAYGVAGTGVAGGGGYKWPNNASYRDGSKAGYGPEGGTGPKMLAYIEVAGASCLYNVWSSRGLEHLTKVMNGLRRVR
ncbi:MAG: hypothetical protein AB7P03_21290 [Kofleriaceae bacterium]